MRQNLKRSDHSTLTTHLACDRPPAADLAFEMKLLETGAEQAKLFIYKWSGATLVIGKGQHLVMGFQYRADATRFRHELEERMSRFNLELHPEKTRLLEFGRFAAENHKKRGEGKPSTFDFLGFTHICGKKRSGKFAVLRKTIRKRMCAKLKEVKTELKVRMHDPVSSVGKYLASMLRGHYQYYGAPWNTYALYAFRRAVIGLWHQVISRRSQMAR
jgi:RNA-directed DNA polymerase